MPDNSKSREVNFSREASPVHPETDITRRLNEFSIRENPPISDQLHQKIEQSLTHKTQQLADTRAYLVTNPGKSGSIRKTIARLSAEVQFLTPLVAKPTASVNATELKIYQSIREFDASYEGKMAASLKKASGSATISSSAINAALEKHKKAQLSIEQELADLSSWSQKTDKQSLRDAQRSFEVESNNFIEKSVMKTIKSFQSIKDRTFLTKSNIGTLNTDIGRTLQDLSDKEDNTFSEHEKSRIREASDQLNKIISGIDKQLHESKNSLEKNTLSDYSQDFQSYYADLQGYQKILQEEGHSKFKEILQNLSSELRSEGENNEAKKNAIRDLQQHETRLDVYVQRLDVHMRTLAHAGEQHFFADKLIRQGIQIKVLERQYQDLQKLRSQNTPPETMEQILSGSASRQLETPISQHIRGTLTTSLNEHVAALGRIICTTPPSLTKRFPISSDPEKNSTIGHIEDVRYQVVKALEERTLELKQRSTAIWRLQGSPDFNDHMDQLIDLYPEKQQELNRELDYWHQETVLQRQQVQILTNFIKSPTTQPHLTSDASIDHTFGANLDAMEQRTTICEEIQQSVILCRKNFDAQYNLEAEKLSKLY